MTRRSKDDLDRLERSLAEIHRACPTPFVGDEWAQRVMRDVRREAATAGKRVRPIDVYVWRTAAVAATFAAIFAGSVFLYTGSENGELTALLSEEWEPTPALLE